MTTTEEVKEHFKNAKVVRCLWSDGIYRYNGDVNLTDVGDSEGASYWDGNDTKLWLGGKYAEIVSYKDEESSTSVLDEALHNFDKSNVEHLQRQTIPDGDVVTKFLSLKPKTKTKGNAIDDLPDNHISVIERALRFQIDTLTSVVQSLESDSDSLDTIMPEIKSCRMILNRIR